MGKSVFLEKFEEKLALVNKKLLKVEELLLDFDEQQQMENLNKKLDGEI